MFTVNNKKNTRLGTIKIRKEIIETPFFMPDATRGFIKSVSNNDLVNLGMGPMVVNTYHLFLRPGIKKIKKAGGIHKFMGWPGPLLSDSGGFQVFSLIHQNPDMGKINDEEVIFKSPIDGSRHVLTPEKSIQIQFDLGVDMMVTLDDCPPNNVSKENLENAVERTIAWAKRCAVEYDKQVKKKKLNKDNRPLIFSVIQGGEDLELRKKCFDGLESVAPKNGWDGFGYGARPVDSDGNFLEEVLKYIANLIPENKIRFALGVGTPEDIVRCAKMGWDMFDCVIPTREGRHGRLFVWKGKPKVKGDFYKTINIVNSKFTNDFSPINKDSNLKELREHSKAYLYHLFKQKEPLGQRLASMNNLEFYMDLTNKLKN